jgi:hypothetical protein
MAEGKLGQSALENAAASEVKALEQEIVTETARLAPISRITALFGTEYETVSVRAITSMATTSTKFLCIYVKPSSGLSTGVTSVVELLINVTFFWTRAYPRCSLVESRESRREWLTEAVMG